MHFPKWCQKLPKCLQKFGKKRLGKDTIQVKLLGLEIQISRELPPNIPHELTVVIPRVEYRLTRQSPEMSLSGEILLNSITIAHSPRFERSEGNIPVSVGRLPAERK